MVSARSRARWIAPALLVLGLAACEGRQATDELRAASL